MSTPKKKKSTGWGGARKDAGRPPREGGTVKICVSVNAQAWQSAVSRWRDKPSWLVDWLVQDYIKNSERAVV